MEIKKINKNAEEYKDWVKFVLNSLAGKSESEQCHVGVGEFRELLELTNKLVCDMQDKIKELAGE